MNGKCINLIPAHRRDARARSRRLRAWIIGGGSYAVLLVFACLASYGIWGGDQLAMAAQTERTARQLEETQRVNAKLQPELAEAQGKLNMIKVVAEQPDWSVLLRLLAKSCSDQIALSSCKLDEPGGDPSARARAAKPPSPQSDHAPHLLVVAGFGRSQAEVSRFVLRLEEAKLFDQVSLIKTSREPFGTGEAVAFR
ncbi:MAG TPA: hypothetical protein VL282_19035, partial [Tepidisphaeraceae bacterium]|nr:hypothetical protein [Tepidisphaeraceae bacterium]